jgi:Txe/YoeB family toxin of Txe-Axe toxin-antitoxin module
MEARVIFADESLKMTFEALKVEDLRLYKEIGNALDTIKQNAFFGRNVRKSLIPKDLAKKFNIDNLWVYNLRKDWRLLYTITDNGVEVLALILDWMSHKDYERLFKF